MIRHVVSAMGAVLLLVPLLDAREPPPQTVESLEQRILDILERHNTPGLIGTIVVGSDTVWTGNLGIADRAGNQPVTDGTPSVSYTHLRAHET